MKRMLTSKGALFNEDQKKLISFSSLSQNIQTDSQSMKLDEEMTLKPVEQNASSLVSMTPPESSLYCGVANVTLKYKARAISSTAEPRSVSLHTIRTTHALCLLCNRNDFWTQCANKTALVPYNENVYQHKKVVKTTGTSYSIGFLSLQFTSYKVEKATIEHILEQRFIFDDKHRRWWNTSLILHLKESSAKFKPEDNDLGKASGVKRSNGTKWEFGYSRLLNITLKIGFVTGVILSLLTIYSLFVKFAGISQIK